MWLNLIRDGKKKLSPQEVLVLASLSKEYQPAKEILTKIKSQTRYWEPEAGVIYPILHRLKANDLLEKVQDQHMKFKLSDRGFELLATSFPQFLQQFFETMDFYEIISETLVAVDPMLAHSYLVKVEERYEQSKEAIETLKQKAIDLTEEENWSEINVEY